MQRQNSPERDAGVNVASLSRLFPMGQRVVVFEGVPLTRTKGRRWGRKLGYHRRDRMLVPHLPGVPLDVNWQNRHDFPSSVVSSAADPFDLAKTRLSRRSTHGQIFTATLDLSPEITDELWSCTATDFTQTEHSISMGETPRQEYLRLLISELALGTSLEVDTPQGTYIATAESETARPLIFSQFQLYDWRMFDDNPLIEGLYLPDSIGKTGLLSVLGARFTWDDHHQYDNSSIEPQGTNRPLAPV